MLYTFVIVITNTIIKPYIMDFFTQAVGAYSQNTSYLKREISLSNLLSLQRLLHLSDANQIAKHYALKGVVLNNSIVEDIIESYKNPVSSCCYEPIDSNTQDGHGTCQGCFENATPYRV